MNRVIPPADHQVPAWSAPRWPRCAPEADAALAALGGAGAAGGRGTVRPSGDIDTDIDAIRLALGR